jgi:AcrR family transcriptional regulator
MTIRSPAARSPEARKPASPARKGAARLGTAAMRKPRQPDRNRSRILAAAIEEFSARGIRGASMDAIAARTHTTRAMINYYFGGKEALYLAVLHFVYRGIRETESRLDIDHLAPVDAIRHLVGFTFDYYVAHPGFVSLVVAENQAQGRYLKKSRAMRSLNLSIIDLLARVIARGQRDGSFRRDVNPIEVHLAISALGFFNIANQHTFGTLFRYEMGARGDVRHRRNLATDIVLSYLQNRAGRRRTPSRR